MRLSRLLGKTLRQSPADAHLISHQLLARAGFVTSLEPGLFAYLPLGKLALNRLQRLVRHEVGQVGAQEIDLPAQGGREPAEAMIQVARREVDSYRQLPALLFRLGSEATPQVGARLGLFGASQRPVVDLYALGDAGLASGESLLEAALREVWPACGLAVVWAAAGAFGRQAAFFHPAGDQEIMRCPACGYAALRAWAETRWPDPPDEPQLPPAEIATPGCDTIAGLAEFLDIPASKTLKMVFYSVEGRVTCVVVRGDRLVDEAKLARVLGTSRYYSSLEEELAAIGAVGGYASPIGLDAGRVRIVADPSVRSGRNFVSGANRPDYHLQNVNLPRDFVPGEWAPLALIERGDPCPDCGGPLELETAFVLARSSPAAPCQPEVEYLDAAGKGLPLWMATGRLDIGRLLAAVVEAHHDEQGILWPAACAPVQVHLVALDMSREPVAAQAEALYGWLKGKGLAVLYDDRPASAGVKFNDADLIGAPLRLTVSKRSLEEGLVEAKWRAGTERRKLDGQELAAELARLEGDASIKL
jgi:prolyl-tRNA synthetase